MIHRMKSIVPMKQEPVLIDLYGYSSKGLPGIEIVGVGSRGRELKEKLVYLSKMVGASFPLKRFVICVEMKRPTKDFSPETLRWLELPLLTMLWAMGENLPIYKLDDCFCAGKLFADGKVQLLDLFKILNSEDMEQELEDYKYITSSKSLVPEYCHLVDVEDLFEKYAELDFILTYDERSPYPREPPMVGGDQFRARTYN